MKSLIMITCCLTAFLFLNCRAMAYPCQKIEFDFVQKNKVRVLKQDLLVSWRFSEDCEGFEDHTDRFVILLTDIFNKKLVADTTDGFKYLIRPQSLELIGDLCIIEVRELGTDFIATMAIEVDEYAIDLPDKPVERLNVLLLNGYFLNALSIIKDLERPDLIPAIEEQYAIMFPQNYTGKRSFFNTYLDKEIKRLTIMPYVTGLDKFVTELNKRNLKFTPRNDPYFINIRISPDNEVVSIEADPLIAKTVKELAGSMFFDNRIGKEATVLIKLSTTDKYGKFIIVNRRALLDPESESFRKRFPYTGGIH